MKTIKKLDVPEIEEFYGRVEAYSSGLLGTIEAINEEELSRLKETIESLGQERRVYVAGNGGSYDNAVTIAHWLRRSGYRASVAGAPEDFESISRTKGYPQIFVETLCEEGLREGELVIGISGSGNSPNIINAFRHAAEVGAIVHALGGRDGGEMKKLAGAHNSAIAISESMEAIEDAHLYMFMMVVRALQRGVTIGEAKEAVVKGLRGYFNDQNVMKLAAIADGAYRTFINNTRIFIIGNTTGANHVVSDLGRGASIGAPARGFCAIDLPSTNALMATANDAGYPATLVHWLGKHEPKSGDFVLLMNVCGNEAQVGEVRKFMRRRELPFMEIGGDGLDIGVFEGYEQDTVAAMTGHILGETLRAFIQKQFDVKARADLQNEVSGLYPEGWRQLPEEQTLEVEAKLRTEGRLSEDRVLVFAYGKVHDAIDPAVFGLQRNFYQ